MADTDNRDVPTPVTDADLAIPPADASFTPAEPLKDAGVAFTSAVEDGDAVGTGAQAEAGGTPGTTPEAATAASQSLKEGATALRGQAQDKARTFADQGKAKATDSLGQLAQMLTDAATQVDDKIGTQYGQYARTAADKVQGFSSAIDAKDIDELIEDARALVRKSPAAAVGIAAGLGFVVARVLSSGLDQRDA